MAFVSDVSGNKCIQCWWVSFRDGDVSRFCEFLVLALGFLGKMMGAKVLVEVSWEVEI